MPCITFGCASHPGNQWFSRDEPSSRVCPAAAPPSARVLHGSGPRARGPFIDVNCAAIPETMLEAELFGFEASAFTDAKRAKAGLFEAASAGTLFLDEIDTFPMVL